MVKKRKLFRGFRGRAHPLLLRCFSRVPIRPALRQAPPEVIVCNDIDAHASVREKLDDSQTLTPSASLPLCPKSSTFFSTPKRLYTLLMENKLEKEAAQTAAAPLVDALSQIFHSSSKLNNGFNVIEERINKLEQSTLSSEKSTLSIVSDMSADMSLALDNIQILDSKVNALAELMKTSTEELAKRMTQLSVDIANLLASVKLKKK